MDGVSDDERKREAPEDTTGGGTPVKHRRRRKRKEKKQTYKPQSINYILLLSTNMPRTCVPKIKYPHGGRNEMLPAESHRSSSLYISTSKCKTFHFSVSLQITTNTHKDT